MLILFVTMILNADINTQVGKTTSEQEAKRDSKQQSNQSSQNSSKTFTEGNEHSKTKTIMTTLSKLSSLNRTVSKSINGNWTITVNPVPYIFTSLRELGWNEKSFWLTQADIGTLDYIVDSDEEFGELENVDKFQATQNRAISRGKLSRSQTMKLQKYINLLYYTAKLVEKTSILLQNFPTLNIYSLENSVKQTLLKAYKQTKVRPINIKSCYYGGDINSYSCDNGKYTLVLTHGIPNLLINGAPYYTATSIGYITPTLNISFATTTNEAFSLIAQNQKSKSLAGIIRDYTSKLKQEGQSTIATQIENKFIEKALTTNVSRTTNAAVQAINSGSPLAVLKLFQ
jgi:hypothetical protein